MIEADGLPESDRRDDCPHPRETSALVGHRAAEQDLLNAFRSDRMHHAWLISGAVGVGKATLAYRLARFALAHENPASPEVANATDLYVPPDNPAARRIARMAHPDLFVLRRGWNAERKTFYGEIRVDDVRRAVSFFGSTAGEGGWRVAIVDTADDLNGAAANALLKALEEPPARAIFLLLSATPRALPAPVRSRCRSLRLDPLSASETLRVLTGLPDIADEHEPEALAAAADLAEGSVSRAISLLASDGAALRQIVGGLLERLPAIDVRAAHSLAEDLARRGGEERFGLFVTLVGDWLHERVASGAALREPRLARVAELWEKTARSAREIEVFNLDRRPFVLETLAQLAGLASR
ncbi:DNA polymerase III subunit delta' [Hansschlegelia plantiphila]|uniref:DNA polymerase III subunit delta n=1 Tax=Hansschlegelia plantiphila TaxID=374655 RepID=A0A9W6MV07_9HYPH|nr:DNA polymerase III subunit delta' [Hansschlegelia plantiphila]GLK67467.1 DNA polymerase III subunit delta' [Hansschlegelia plantiphila]